MARSRRHTPIASITTAASEKQDKRRANRIHRSAARSIVKRDTDPDAIPDAVLSAVYSIAALVPEAAEEWSEGLFLADHNHECLSEGAYSLALEGAYDWPFRVGRIERDAFRTFGMHVEVGTGWRMDLYPNAA